jgi:multiple sugar transport system ATP-binding protein
MAEVRIRNLIKEFDRGATAVDGLDIDIGEGEFVFLLGPSGCGKTTTLRMIAGLEMPTSGRIEIGGRNVTFLRPRYRNVGMVFQHHGLYEHMTVYNNMAYPLRVRRWATPDIERRVNDVAHRLKIADVLTRRPAELSGGQTQRVAIGRMLVRDAYIFLMDEPISHLDAQLRAHLRTELRHLQKQIGVTTIFVTHDQLEAMTMADRIIIMRDGRLQQFATPKEIFDHPVNEFVATFVGEPQMNVLDCTIEQIGNRYVAVGPNFRVTLNRTWFESSAAYNSTSREMRLGIRPEHISFRSKPDEDYHVSGSIFAVEPTGAENMFAVSLAETVVIVKAPTASTNHIDISEGHPTYLAFDKAHLYLFDRQTGATLAQGSSLDNCANIER